jgi:hypothetical protein
MSGPTVSACLAIYKITKMLSKVVPAYIWSSSASSVLEIAMANLVILPILIDIWLHIIES